MTTIETPIGPMSITVDSARHVTGNLTAKHPTAGTSYEFKVAASRQWGDEFESAWQIRMRKIGSNRSWTHFYGPTAWQGFGQTLKIHVIPCLVGWANANRAVFSQFEIEDIKRRITGYEEELTELRQKLATLEASQTPE